MPACRRRQRHKAAKVSRRPVVPCEVQPSQATVALSDGRVGRLHATEVGDRAGAPMPAGRFPLDSIRAGEAIEVVTLGRAGDRGSMLEVSTRRTPEEAREAAATAEHAGAGRRASTEGSSLAGRRKATRFSMSMEDLASSTAISRG